MPSESMGQTWADWIRMTMYLDKKGNITSMEGKKTREQPIFGVTLPFMKKTLAEFKCNIEHPAVPETTKSDDSSRKAKPKVEQIQGSKEALKSIQQ